MAFTPAQMSMLGTGGAMAGLGLGSLLSSWQNPADAAMGSLNKIPSTMTPYYQPYIDAGKQAIPALQGQYSSLLNNPGEKLNQIGGSYQQSPGYQFALDQALRASNNRAAAGGMYGTTQNQMENMQYATGLANQDYYNWLGHALGLYGTGLSGESHFMDTGYNASNELSQSLANALMQQSGLEYQGANAENQHNQGALGSLLGGIGTIGSLLAFA